MASQVASIASLASASLASELCKKLWEVLWICRQNKSSDIAPYVSVIPLKLFQPSLAFLVEHLTYNFHGSSVFDNFGLRKDSFVAAETIQRVFSDLHFLCVDFAFLLGILHSPSLDHRIKHPIDNTVSIFGQNLNSSEIVAALSLLQPGLEELSVHGLDIRDDFLRTLAASPAASTLKVLALRGTMLTDASASEWIKFPQLLHVDLYSSTLIGPKTFEAILSLPLVEHICTELCDLLSGLSLMNMVGDINPPNLRVLQLSVAHEIRYGQKWKSDFLEPLSRWSGRVNVDISIGGPLNDKRFCEFFELCPNISKLIGSLSEDTIQKYANSLSGIRRLEIYHDYAGDSESVLGMMLAEYGGKMPLVDDLLISGCPSDWDWLASFPNLTELNIFSKGSETPFTDPIAWPSNLRSLTLNLSRRHFDANVISQTVKQICRHTTVESLTLGPTNLITVDDIELVLKSLPNLIFLEFDNGWSENEPETPTVIEVSHPNLKHLQAYGRDPFFAFTYKNTPNLVEIDGSEAYFGHAVSKENTRSLPKLQKLTGPGSMLSDETWAALPAICPNINFIYAGSFFSSFIELKHLNHLWLSSAAVSGEELKAALDQMPQLSNLRLSKCSEIKNLDWLCHVNLRGLHVSFVATPACRLMIHLDNAGIPSITSIEIEGGYMEKVAIVNLDQLVSLEITCADANAPETKDQTTIAVANCSLLNRLSVIGARTGSQLKVSKLRSLEVLDLTDSDFSAPHSSILAADCPKLARFRVEAPEPANISRTLSAEFPNATIMN